MTLKRLFRICSVRIQEVQSAFSEWTCLGMFWVWVGGSTNNALFVTTLTDDLTANLMRTVSVVGCFTWPGCWFLSSWDPAHFPPGLPLTIPNHPRGAIRLCFYFAYLLCAFVFHLEALYLPACKLWHFHLCNKPLNCCCWPASSALWSYPCYLAHTPAWQ